MLLLYTEDCVIKVTNGPKRPCDIMNAFYIKTFMFEILTEAVFKLMCQELLVFFMSCH